MTDASQERNTSESEFTGSWQAAKEDTQRTALEIAQNLPESFVSYIDQQEKGSLFSCDSSRFRWKGSTKVTLVDEAIAEELVRELGELDWDGRFEVGSRIDAGGSYELQLWSEDSAESYLISEDLAPNTVRIASGSPCFTLPDGVYPGGEF